MTDWNRIREDFPVTKNIVYFQSAGMSPVPNPVYQNIIDNYKVINQFGDIHWEKDMEKFKHLCASIASMINSKTDNIAFMPSTSQIMSTLALSFKHNMKKPFNIVSMQDEFPASTVGWEFQGISMKYVEPIQGRYSLESILSCIDKKTAAVITSQVQYATGFRQDLVTLGRELNKRKILLIVNATQGLPIFPIDTKKMHIDVLSASIHKWGMTGHIGALFFSSESFRKKFPSPMAGWLSIAPSSDDFIHTAKNQSFKLWDSARSYQLGTFNLQPLLAFQTALNYMNKIGFENIRKRIFELTDHLIQGLQELDIQIISPIDHLEERSAIVTFSLGDKSLPCIKTLEEKKIYVSFRAGNIRISLNIFNNHTDIDILLKALQEFRS
ncbi:MAG: aminotransferase class V-fold PLP-dependent enzyme [Candidatus Aminicenantes bacterium]|nr:aminotransferase class V-fold PLP-dependent enzyme [Candidatus Aminicenantes bacterium]